MDKQMKKMVAITGGKKIPCKFSAKSVHAAVAGYPTKMNVDIYTHKGVYLDILQVGSVYLSTAKAKELSKLLQMALEYLSEQTEQTE